MDENQIDYLPTFLKGNTMIDLIKPVLLEFLNGISPSETKTITKEVDISELGPLEVAGFMRKNNIPDSASFSGEPNGYDGYVPGVLLLSWEIQVPTTVEERAERIKKRFNAGYFKRVYDVLVVNDYKRVGCNSGLFKEFDDTTPYDLVLEEDWRRLEKRILLSFKKKTKQD